MLFSALLLLCLPFSQKSLNLIELGELLEQECGYLPSHILYKQDQRQLFTALTTTTTTTATARATNSAMTTTTTNSTTNIKVASKTAHLHNFW